MIAKPNCSPIRRVWMATFFVLSCAVLGGVDAQSTSAKTNAFSDPFVQVTSKISTCPVPQGPGYTAQEAKEQAHYRAERGTSCYLSGRCRLPNAYLYDQEIISRVGKAIHSDSRFVNTSLWASSQRRWVTLQGCVHTEADSLAMEQLVRGLDDVEAVINDLTVIP